MRKSTLKSAPLVCGALLATICTVAEPVEAVPTTIGVTLFAHAPGLATQYSTIVGTHNFGAQGQVMGAAPYTITVSSNPSGRPGWQYEMTVNTTAYDPGFFVPFGITRLTMDLTGIKQPGAPDLVSSFQIKHAGTAGTLFTSSQSSLIGGGTGIHVDIGISEIDPGDNIFIVQWNQTVPAPGALALLGMAGVVGSRRRRRA